MTPRLTGLDYFPDHVNHFRCDKTIPYSDILKVVDKIEGDIEYGMVKLDKSEVRKDSILASVLQHKELGNLNI